MIAETFEEQTASQQRKLKRLDIDTYTISVPCIGSDPIRDKAREEAVEIEQEQDGPTRESNPNFRNIGVGH